MKNNVGVTLLPREVWTHPLFSTGDNSKSLFPTMWLPSPGNSKKYDPEGSPWIPSNHFRV